MSSFQYFLLSALFGGVIGGGLGAMLTLKIFGDHPAEMRLQLEATPRLPRREPVEHDYIPEIWILFKIGEFSFLLFLV